MSDRQCTHRGQPVTIHGTAHYIELHAEHCIACAMEGHERLHGMDYVAELLRTKALLGRELREHEQRAVRLGRTLSADGVAALTEVLDAAAPRVDVLAKPEERAFQDIVFSATAEG